MVNLCEAVTWLILACEQAFGGEREKRKGL